MQANPMEYSGFLRTATKTVGEEGIRALWKGAVPMAVGMMGENCAAFGVNEALKRAFPDNDGEDYGDKHQRPNLLKPFLLGPITGIFAGLALLPGDVIKAKTQVMKGTGLSSNHVLKKMLKRQGVKSLFCGLDGQLMLNGAFYAVFFGSYDLNCYLFRTHVPNMPEELNYFLSGGFAGMMGWCVSMPFDVPKTKVQSGWDTKVIGSYFPAMVSVVKEHGFLGLYRGLGPTLTRAFPANAALFFGVEMGRKIFDGGTRRYDDMYRSETIEERS